MLSYWRSEEPLWPQMLSTCGLGTVVVECMGNLLQGGFRNWPGDFLCEEGAGLFCFLNITVAYATY